MNMSAMTVEAQDIYMHNTGIIKRITQHETAGPQHLQKAPALVNTRGYRHSSASQPSLSGFVSIALTPYLAQLDSSYRQNTTGVLFLLWLGQLF